MNDEAPNDAPRPVDNLEIDLAQSFLPAWAREDSGGGNISKLAAKFQHSSQSGDLDSKRFRSKGGGRDPRSFADRNSKRPSRDDRNRSPRGERSENRSDSHRNSARPERNNEPPTPTLVGWEVRFLPQRQGIEGLAKQIKSTARAYPLFRLARLVLEKSERYQVELKRSAESAPELFQVRADGSLWLDENAALQRALQLDFDTFYRRESVATPPPKGNFPGVAKCGISGILLGPPNYHGYQSKLREIHAQKFPTMRFDDYVARVKVEKDEALVEQWKQEQSTREEFVANDVTPASETLTPSDSESPSTEQESLNENPSAEIQTTVPVVAPEVADELPPAAPVADHGSTPETPADSGSEIPSVPSDATEPSESLDAEPEMPASAAPRFLSLADVLVHFRDNHAKRSVIKIRDRVVAPGSSALNSSDPAILSLTRGVWAELDKFPLPLAHSISRQLTGRGLQIFKSSDNITFVSIARPTPLDITTTPVSDAVKAMLESIATHSKSPRHEQWKALIDLRPIPPDGTEAERNHAVAADLSWLLHAGHVVDYAERGLAVARRSASRENQISKQAPRVQE